VLIKRGEVVLKLACILIPHLPFYAEAQRRPELRREAVIIARTRGSKRTVADFSPGISGIRHGMPLQMAATVVSPRSQSGVKLVEADDAYYHVQWNEVLDALAERSPDVDDADLGCAYAGMDGLEELYGGDARLVLALQSAVPEHFHTRIGVGCGKFAAYLAALSAPDPGRGLARAFKAPPDTQRFLASFPVGVLPVGFRTKARLRRFALRTLGDIAALPLGAMQAQFGPEGKLMWELAKGIDKSALVPRRVEEVVTESLSFAEPVATLEPILLGAEVLLARAFVRPDLKGRCARLIDLQGQVYRRATWTKQFTFKAPVGDARQAVLRIRTGLENAGIPGPLETLALSLKGLTGETGQQSSLFSDVRRHEQLQQALRQLDAVLGKQAPVYHIREVEPWSRLPERRHALVPVVR
jgi:DNA polymerase-4/protein ImuB